MIILKKPQRDETLVDKIIFIYEKRFISLQKRHLRNRCIG